MSDQEDKPIESPGGGAGTVLSAAGDRNVRSTPVKAGSAAATPRPSSGIAWIALLLVFGSFFGGCVGSTCGGIKAFRFLLLYRQSAREVRLLIHPAAEIAIKIGGKPTSERIMDAVWGFYFLYIVSYCVLSLGVATTGVDLVTAFGSVAGCLNNMGVGLGETSTTFGVLHDDAKWMLSLSMLVGRLEVFPLLLIFTKDFWR